MINQSFTAVVERAENVTGTFETEPYEAAWAREAILFLKILAMAPGATITARVQISPDGIDWVDEGTYFPRATEEGIGFVKLTNFGTWLRVVGSFEAASQSAGGADLAVYIALKA